MRIAIIPARGGSKRIKNKNIMDFYGHPMIYYSLQAAKDSGLFDKIHVSTESLEIRQVVESLGFPVDFLRPRNLADDVTPLMPVLRHVLSEFQLRGQKYDTVCLLLPCAPLIESADLSEAHALFDRHEPKKALLAVSPYPVPVEWAFERKQDGTLSPVQPGMYAVRSQDLTRKYYDAGAFVFYHQTHILGETPAADQDYISYVLARSKAVDIDDEEDLELATALFHARRQNVAARKRTS